MFIKALPYGIGAHFKEIRFERDTKDEPRSLNLPLAIGRGCVITSRIIPSGVILQALQP